MSDLVTRHIAGTARRHLEHFPIVVVEGARQVGKSTLAKALVPDAIVLNLDLPQVLDAVAADPVGILDQSPDRPIIVDEIQLMPALTRVVKGLVDADRRPGRFILTGSSSLLRMTGTSDSLAGRASRLKLHGFSPSEILRLPPSSLVQAIVGGADLTGFRSTSSRLDYVALCSAGSYPEANRLPPDLRAAWFESYLAGILHRDLVELRRRIQPQRAEAVFRQLSTQQMGETVKAKLGASTSIPATSVEAYLDLLRDVHLVTSIRPWKPVLARRETGKPKTLVLDSGLAMHASGITEEHVANMLHQEDFGRFLEGFVAAELVKQRSWSRTPYNVYHYRESDGVEVDLVLELPGGQIIGVEVKAATTFQARQFRGLVKLRDRLGDRFLAGVVLNTGTEAYRYSPKLWGLPVAALWELPAAQDEDQID